MPELAIRIQGAEPVPYAASPTLRFHAVAHTRDAETIQSLALRCQIMIETSRRRYEPTEKLALLDVFGAPETWSRSLHPLLLAQTGAIVPAFLGEARFDMTIPCTYDLDIAATRFLRALDGGDIPLLFLFSGTAHVADARGDIFPRPIGQDAEARFALPASTWRALMDRHFPNSGWVRLRQDVLERLLQHRSRCALPTWEAAIESLLANQTLEVAP